jgi:hypothetical protein
MSITLRGLTPEQVKLLDKLWALDTQEEVDAWFDSLDTKSFQQAVVLQEMVIEAMLEQTADGDLSVARSMLENIGVKV